MTRGDEVKRLRRERPKDHVVRWSFGIFALLLGAAWLSGEFEVGTIDWERRWENCQRFLEKAQPFPVQQQPDASWTTKGRLVWEWIGGQWQTHGREAFVYTLGLSVVAIVLAGMGSLLSLPVASRQLTAASPWLPGVVGSRWWPWVGRGARFLLILARSIPEYMIAFFLVVSLGYNAWPAVLALAIHNAGILGRLGSELVDNQPRNVPGTLRELGAGRRQVYFLGSVPSLFSRFLVFFFYRWETCVRDATVLGMLGIPTLGYYLLEARAKDHLDSMLFFVLMGSVAVMMGDLVSTVVRWRLRKGEA